MKKEIEIYLNDDDRAIEIDSQLKAMGIVMEPQVTEHWENMRSGIDMLWCNCIIDDKERDEMKSRLRNRIIISVKALPKLKKYIEEHPLLFT